MDAQVAWVGYRGAGDRSREWLEVEDGGAEKLLETFNHHNQPNDRRYNQFNGYAVSKSKSQHSSCRLLQHACSKKRLPDALSVPRYIGIEVVKEVDI